MRLDELRAQVGALVSGDAPADPEKDAAFVRAMLEDVRAVPWVSRGAILVMTTRSGHDAVRATFATWRATGCNSVTRPIRPPCCGRTVRRWW